MNINDILDNLMKFYPWLYKLTGLESWQLLAIALVVLVLLILLLRYQRKTRIKRIYAFQSADRPDIIGINLTGRDNIHSHERKNEAALLSDDEEEEQSWGQTTKEWRSLTEKIRHLQHEISKYERSEKYLKEQVNELKNTNDSLMSEISRGKQLEKELKQQIRELTNASFANKHDKTGEVKIIREIQDQPKGVSPSFESLTIMQTQEEGIDNLQNTAQKHDEHTAAISEHQVNAQKSVQIIKDTEHISDETAVNESQDQAAGNKNKIPEDITQQDIEQSETAEREIGVPLDIKELKAIADLARRLQARSQQHQNE